MGPGQLMLCPVGQVGQPNDSLAAALVAFEPAPAVMFRRCHGALARS